MVLGCSAVITPLNVQGITGIDFIMLIVSGILLFIFGLIYKTRTITRWEGIFLVLCFIVYMTHIVMNAKA